ncbi:MAG: hypothetical protein AAF798_22015 [Bacteroidota bacterium]
MENKNKIAEKLFLSLGIITVISGVALVVMGNWFLGISGSIVGLSIAVKNFQKLRAKDQV